MSQLTPREKLDLAVRARFVEMGMPPRGAERAAADAVEAYYAEQHEHQYHALVSAEAVQIMLDTMPSFVTSFRAAFESMRDTLHQVARVGRELTPYAELITPLHLGRDPIGPKYDASGLPISEGPNIDIPEDFDGPEPPISEDIADEVSREDTGRPAGALVPYHRTSDAPAPNFVFFPGGMPEGTVELDGVDISSSITSVEFGESESPIVQLTPNDVIELTEREWHIAAARRLRALGCSFSELEAMAQGGDFPTSQHHSVWFQFGGIINREQLDRANFVIDMVDGPGGLMDLDDAHIERLEERYPTDRITGAPHHVIINGDHDGCGCGGHSPKCEVWSIPYWVHKPSLCLITRTLCLCTPKHTYGQACGEYHEGIGQ